MQSSKGRSKTSEVVRAALRVYLDCLREVHLTIYAATVQDEVRSVVSFARSLPDGHSVHDLLGQQNVLSKSARCVEATGATENMHDAAKRDLGFSAMSFPIALHTPRRRHLQADLFMNALEEGAAPTYTRLVHDALQKAKSEPCPEDVGRLL